MVGGEDLVQHGPVGPAARLPGSPARPRAVVVRVVGVGE